MMGLYEFYNAVCDFHDMMMSDFDIERDRAVQMGDAKSVAKMVLLNNMLDEYSDIFEYARLQLQMMEQEDDVDD